MTVAAPPSTFVIFGAMGDLAKRLLTPSLVNLAKDGLLSEETAIIGVSYHPGDDDTLRDALGAFVGKDDGAAWEALKPRIAYHKGDFTEASTYETLARRLDGSVAFYLATAPQFFGPIVEGLADAGALSEASGFRRVMIEKPFGHDLASAQALNRLLIDRIPESQVYRVDHFLGKETVQNIMVARFANSFLEAIWNNRYVDHVQITAAETVGVGTRGRFYDATGALRDMVPNHLFQLLAMIGMEPPASFAPEAVRDEKAKLLGAVRGPCEEDVKHDAVRGRYVGTTASGSRSYVDEESVGPGSRTETYAAIKVSVETWRWAGVPFYLRTGKALSARDTEIVVQFKPVPFALFRETEAGTLPPNRLVLQIQPDEGITLNFLAKRPGPAIATEPVDLAFKYADHFEMRKRTGYETLLYDALVGDQTLFQRADMVEAGWAAVQPILDQWDAEGSPIDYAAGSQGPSAGDALLARDGREWHALG